jgi:hypothetical protein
MAESMAKVVSKKTMHVISDANFLSISADEVTSVDNTSWLSLHIYACQSWKRVLMLLSLHRMVDGGRADVVREMIMSSLVVHGDLSERQIVEKLVCFGADWVSTFQGSRNGVTVQLQKSTAPYIFGVHCMAHRTNLAIEPLSNLPLVNKIESLCKSMHSYFLHSPKRHLEFTKLAEIVETEGLKIVNNVKTRWISLLEPLKRVLGEYKTLIVKMCEDAVVKDL